MYSYPAYFNQQLATIAPSYPYLDSTPVNFKGESVDSLQKPVDSVETSASDNIQKTNKKGMSKGLKWLLGIIGTGASIYGCVVGHRVLSKPSFETVQKNLSEILGKDLSKEEAEKILSKYRGICNESSMEEYLNKLFKEVKKDCGYEDLDLVLKIEKLKDGSFQTFNEHSVNGGAGCVNKEITLYPRTSNNSLSRKDRRTLFGTTWHEFKHVKQNEQAYRADSKALIDAYVQRLEKNHPEFIEEMMKENKCSREDALKDIYEEIGNNLESLFGKYEKYAIGSPEYEKGLKYIENELNYVKDGPEYYTQLVEKEAHEIGDKARPIFDYLANPFKIF